MDPFEIVLVDLGSFWDRFGIVLGSFWYRFGIVFGYFWGRGQCPFSNLELHTFGGPAHVISDIALRWTLSVFVSFAWRQHI